jgi:hypothetical protein
MWCSEKPKKKAELYAVYVRVVVPPFFENTFVINVQQDVVYQFIVPLDSGKPCCLFQQELVCVTLKHL